MKNKALTYILLIVVAAIWYQVFLRIKSNVSAEEGSPADLSRQTVEFQLIRKDTFLLSLNYRDPFTGKAQAAVKDELSLPEQALPPMPIMKPQFVWPKVTYYGWVKKTDSKNPLCIVNIDGILLYLRRGEEVFDGIRVVTVDRDFVELRKGKNQQLFYRK